MDRSNVIYLIGQTITRGTLGQAISTETVKPVYCDIDSINSSEWFQGNQQGMNPAYRVRMFKWDYSGETIVNIGGTLVNGSLSGGDRFSVYRTYEARDDELELYLERQVGTK